MRYLTMRDVTAIGESLPSSREDGRPSTAILLWIGVIVGIVGLVVDFVRIGGSTRHRYETPVRITGSGPTRAGPDPSVWHPRTKKRGPCAGWANKAWVCS